ncbi:MAG: ImmA/IrrE family metallo-endopeptidase [Candidatus Desulforudaceae bacterium]
MKIRADLNRAILSAINTRESCKPDNANSLTVVMLALDHFDLALDVWPFRVNKFAGMLHIPDGQYTITVNRDHPVKKRVFTMAHEIGHYVLHLDQMAEFACSDLFTTENRRIEMEANRFAAELIMPINEFVLAIDAYGINFSKVADHFFVSEEATRWRYVDITSEQLGIPKAEAIEKVIRTYKRNWI